MRTPFFILLSVAAVIACSSNQHANDAASAGASSAGGNGNSGGKGNTSGGKASVGTAGAVHTGPMFAGAECPTDLGFPDAYALPGVKGQVDGANVRISFEPQADAADYRVYVLPKKGDVSADAVQGATYRCAGRTTVPSPPQEDEPREPAPGARTRINSNVEGYVRKTADAKLGYVFTTPGADRVPVYAMGDSDLHADNTDCYQMRWPESRKKRYITSEDERTKLLAQHWRDDGIVFYVPKPGTDGVTTVYQETVTNNGWGAYFYVTDDAERTARKGSGAMEAEAFSVYSETQEGAEPLMRVYYGLTCSHGHDEIVAGQARFAKALAQGDSPVTELHFSGLREETTLVVEALDQQCPYQGAIAPMSRPARVDPFPDGHDIPYPAFQTAAELAATSANGEVFVNGEGDGTAPHAISRACLKVKPEPAPEMDFFYDGTTEAFSDGRYRNFQNEDTDSPTFDVNFYNVATDEWSIGAFNGELWTTYGDWAADTGGKIRITPKARATLAAVSFVHASMEVDIVSSARRYPQLMISTAEVPIQENLKNAMTVVVQPIGGISSPVEGQIQFCDHQEWDVNNQCPLFEIQKLKDDSGDFLAPRPEITGWLGVDRTVRFDVYVSTSRVYWYMNAQPYGCADLPADKLPAGPATVTFGDVLYHSGVDLEAWYPFHLAKMHLHTTRHFSNLGFSSQVAAPAWDEARFPCAPASSLRK
jgi:hypothetical protein